MKKIVSSALAFLLCFSMLFAATACSSKHPIAEFKDKMDKKGSYEVAVTMSIMGMDITVTTQVDGNIQYTPGTGLSSEMYTETTDDGINMYVKDLSGKWTKTSVGLDDADDDMEFMDDKILSELFNPENYEEVEDKKNTYKQKSSITFEEFSGVIMTIDGDTCTIEMSISEDGIGYSVKMVISKVGQINLTLPTVD